jgi:prepilin-type N-terminal cleavage/methylation domain-containing protein
VYEKFSAGGSRGFTLVEMLAAMLFVAIVIPPAARGLMVANRAGVVAERKRVAAELADYLLTETIVTEAWMDGYQEGDFGDEWPEYRWLLEEESWDEDTMREISVAVLFDVQGTEYRVRLSTLVEEEYE